MIIRCTLTRYQISTAENLKLHLICLKYPDFPAANFFMLMLEALVHIMQNVSSQKLYGEMQQTHINIGTGVDLTIKELADMVKEIVGFNGKIEWDTTKPVGTPKKQLYVSLLNKLDWNYEIPLKDGIKSVFKAYTG